MKYFYLVIFFLPICATAASLADCDNNIYDVIVNNAGQIHTQRISPRSGNIYAYGPDVIFQIFGQKPVKVTEPDAEYCIWSGKITIQRRQTLGESSGVNASR